MIDDLITKGIDGRHGVRKAFTRGFQSELAGRNRYNAGILFSDNLFLPIASKLISLGRESARDPQFNLAAVIFERAGREQVRHLVQICLIARTGCNHFNPNPASTLSNAEVWPFVASGLRQFVPPTKRLASV